MSCRPFQGRVEYLKDCWTALRHHNFRMCPMIVLKKNIGPILSDQLLCQAPFPWQQRLHVALGQNASCKGWSLVQVYSFRLAPRCCQRFGSYGGQHSEDFPSRYKVGVPTLGARCCALLLFDLLNHREYVCIYIYICVCIYIYICIHINTI